MWLYKDNPDILHFHHINPQTKILIYPEWYKKITQWIEYLMKYKNVDYFVLPAITKNMALRIIMFKAMALICSAWIANGEV